METKLVTELNPVWVQLNLDALREQGLDAYGKEVNIDGWIRGVDLYLIYDRDSDLARARDIVAALSQPRPDGDRLDE